MLLIAASSSSSDAFATSPIMDFMRSYWLLMAAPLAIYLLIYYAQFLLIYVPGVPEGSRSVVDSPASFAMPYEDVHLTTSDGIMLHAYLMSPPRTNNINSQRSSIPPNTTLLYFHANAGNMGHRLPIAAGLASVMQCRVFILSYRGYGKSEGSPSEAGLKLDAKAALDYLKKRPDTANTKLVVFGQSIGGAVAIDTVSNYHEEAGISALIVENTFLSLPDMVMALFPLFSRLSFLCHQKWPSKDIVGLIPDSVPILFLSSAKDELVPPSHMRALYALSRLTGGTRQFVLLPQGTHNDAPAQPEYFPAIAHFARICGLLST